MKYLRKKKTTPWWVFFFLCFSLQTRKDLAVVKFHNVAVRCFLKTFSVYDASMMWRLFLVKFWFFNMDSATGLSISFPNTFLWLLPKIESNFFEWDNIVGEKTPESSKICQTAIRFTYLVYLNTFSFHLRANFTDFWKIFLTKNP